eukprot:m.111803 g.111803  ORF g.111803 m.111803 type:complete len:450 (+) comp17014_c0_seq1:190-1539(+)
MDTAEEELWGKDDEEIYDDCEDEGDAEMPAEDDSSAAMSEEKMYLPGDTMPENASLTFDPSAYLTFNEWTAEWPCLSVDILPDALGASRQTFPMTAYIVAGSQAGEEGADEILVQKISDIKQTSKQFEDDEDEDDDSDDEDGASQARLQTFGIKHKGAINRIKACPHPGNIIATWSDRGKVYLYDVTEPVAALDKGEKCVRHSKRAAEFSFRHQDEGYALGWSRVVPYRMASGDNASFIHVWNRRDDGSWAVNPKPCAAHTASVEDIEWSPSEQNVFASCGADRSIRIWDVRTGNRCAISVEAHPTHDLNALSWNRCEQHLLCSGADDGSFQVWDLRSFPKGSPEPVANFKWHTDAVTSVEWHPTDASVICVTGEDNQVSIWDMAVETDAEASSAGSASSQRDVPPQLLFIHQGQQHVKDAHWHSQLPGVIVSTAENGFNLFKTISVTQ